MSMGTESAVECVLTTRDAAAAWGEIVWHLLEDPALVGPACGYAHRRSLPVEDRMLTTASALRAGTRPVRERLARLAELERVMAAQCAARYRMVVDLVGAEPAADSMHDRHARTEVALVLRVGEGAASSLIATARTIVRDYPAFLAALDAGEVSEWHCRELVSGTRYVSDHETIAALQMRLLPKAKRQTPAEFRKAVRMAMAALDADAVEERRDAARRDRYVGYRTLDDGLAYLGICTDQPTAAMMHAAILDRGADLLALRGGAAALRAGNPDASADACRADAAAALILGTRDDDGTVTWDPSGVQVTMVVVGDVETFAGTVDRPGLLDGEPVPSTVAREIAGIATTWRRAVVDPVTGHLLDYGREQYLPEKLRDYILARDLCRAPGCTARSLSRLEMDHAVAFPEGGTSAQNCGGLCRAHHQIKTAGRADIQGSRSDGSATWITAWGQRIAIPPRPFLHDPADERPSQPPQPPQPPPADDRPASRVPRPPARGGFDARECDGPLEPPF
ncbi:MAG TPA: DUF222 domain-containing protein [Candidatus Nanopelagicales bacterium]|nr:DUF222 domain-containing protein [Candidatus Nanopelagicales bacterium]